MFSYFRPDTNWHRSGATWRTKNFQLDASDGQKALSEGKSPIQAFLDCVLASVEKENSEEGKGDTQGDEDGDADMGAN